MMAIPPLPEALDRLFKTEYPRFSDAEMQRRRRLIDDMLKEAGCDHLIFCSANR